MPPRPTIPPSNNLTQTAGNITEQSLTDAMDALIRATEPPRIADPLSITDAERRERHAMYERAYRRQHGLPEPARPTRNFLAQAQEANRLLQQQWQAQISAYQVTFSNHLDIVTAPRPMPAVPVSLGEQIVRARQRVDAVERIKAMEHMKDEPTEDFAAREQKRFDSGRYKALPWVNAEWVSRPETAHHFAHIAERDPYLIAYHPTPEHGKKDRHVTIKPGRYLQKYYADRLTPEQIIELASQVRGAGIDIRLTKDPKTIERLYQSGGMTACMSHTASHYLGSHYAGMRHPTHVYSLSDLAVAAGISPEDQTTPVARALVWPDRKTHTRAYGDHEAMTKALANRGYNPGLLDGAALPAIPLELGCGGPNRFLCPYIDHIKWARLSDDKSQLILSSRATGATHSVQHGDGVAYPIADAPPRPVGHEIPGREHKRLIALEAEGKEPPPE